VKLEASFSTILQDIPCPVCSRVGSVTVSISGISRSKAVNCSAIDRDRRRVRDVIIAIELKYDNGQILERSVECVE
jgi:hypothetical protein